MCFGPLKEFEAIRDEKIFLTNLNGKKVFVYLKSGSPNLQIDDRQFEKARDVYLNKTTEFSIVNVSIGSFDDSDKRFTPIFYEVLPLSTDNYLNNKVKREKMILSFSITFCCFFRIYQ